MPEAECRFEDARPIEMTARAERVAVGDVLSTMSVAGVPASGVVAAEATVAGTLSKPRVDLQVQAADLVAYAEPLGTLSVQAGLVERQARVRSLLLEKPQQEGGPGRVSLTGDYSLATRAYSYELTSENLRLEQLTLPGGTPVRGRLEVSGSGRGAVADLRGGVGVTARSLLVADRELET